MTELKRKYFLAPVLMLVLSAFLAVMTCHASAADSQSGTASNGISYTFDGTTGKLTVSGSGEILDGVDAYDYFDYNHCPWLQFRNDIKSIVIENGITAIGKDSFYGTSATSITMADSVKVLAEQAFNQSNSVITVRLSDNIEVIPEMCFWNSYNMTTINMPKKLKRIEYEAFEYCGKLKSVTFPSTLTFIGAMAFESTGLTKVTIPSSVVEIGNDAFEYTPYLSNLTSTAIVGDGILLKYVGTGKSYTVPSTVKSIAGGAFENNEVLEKVIIPSSVKKIGDSAFFNCSKLADVTIPKTVTSIGSSCFAATPFEEKMTGFTILGDGILYKYSGDDKILEIPDGVKVINSNTIDSNFNIEKIIIPEGVKEIGDSAIINCIRLKEIKMPSTIESIGEYGLGYYYSEITYGYITMMSSTYLRVSGPDNEVTRQYFEERGQTYFCPAMYSGSVSDTIFWSFDEETSTLSVYGEGEVPWSDFGWEGSIADQTKRVIVGEGITNIQGYMFRDMNKLTEVILPSTITTISNYAFARSSVIEEIIIPASVSYIGDCAFYGMTSLQNIYVDPDNSYYCDFDGVLYNKNKTMLFAFPAGRTGEFDEILYSATSINDYAFYGSSLSRIIVPATVKWMYNYSFAYGNDKDIVFLGNAPSCYSNSIYPNYGGRYNIYYNPDTTGWDDFISKFSGYSDRIFFLTGGEEAGSGNEDVPSFEKSELSLNSGDKESLNIVNDRASNYYFSSSNPSSVVVSYKGEVLACADGNATISAVNKNTGEELTCEVTVSGCNYEDFEKGVNSFSGLGFDGSDFSPEEDYISEDLFGYYYINNNKLYFASFYCNEAIELYAADVSVYDTFIGDGKLYSLISDGKSAVVDFYDLKTQTREKQVVLDCEYASRLGVDHDGNIYVFRDYKEYVFSGIEVYSPDGEFIDDMICYGAFYDFVAFDKTNGNFYFEGYYNHRTWGYNHDCRAEFGGNFDGEEITYSGQPIHAATAGSFQEAFDGVGTMVLYQQYWYYHNICAEFIGDKYLAMQSVLFGRLYIMNSNNYDALENDTTSFEVSRGGDCSDENTFGANVVYNKSGDSVIYYANDSLLKEISIKNGELLSEVYTSHPLYRLMMMGDKVLAIERDEDKNYYYEFISYKAPESLDIVEKSVSLKVAESKFITVTSDSPAVGQYTYVSSDPSICSATSDGKLVAWKEGSVTITVKWDRFGLSDTLPVTVTKNSALNTVSKSVYNPTGVKVTNNAGAQNYSVWDDPMNSFMYEDSGYYYRVEFIGDKKLLVEKYDSSYKLSTTKTITLPLSIFGGFHHGSDGYNYVVVGQSNPNESDSVEVLRVIKYDKAWNTTPLASYKGYGLNTYIPFDAGNCRMVDIGGNLYVHTCHEMYASDDGYHHQANMTFKFNTSNLSLLDTYYEIMNLDYGYVSHSFNQFIVTDGVNIYRADHGDANPRGLTIVINSLDEKLTDPHIRGSVYGFAGDYGANYTGASLGGFVEADDNVIYAFASADQSVSCYEVQNIYLKMLGKNLDYENLIQVTKYKESDGITVSTPQLVKIDKSHLLLLWEERDSNYEIKCRMVLIDSDGNLCSDIVSPDFRLSDCQPICDSKGIIRWYSSDGENVTFYSIDPYKLDMYAVLEKPVVTLNNSNGGVKVNWEKVGGATGYKVFRKLPSDSKWTTLATVGDELFYLDTTAAAGKNYIYSVQAINDYSTSKMADEKSIKYLAIPEVTLSSSGDTGIKVTWTGTAGASGYYIYKKLPSDKDWKKIDSVSASTFSYTDKDVVSGTTYCYTVRAYSGSTMSTYQTDKKIKFEALVKKITLNKTSATMATKTTLQLSATISDALASQSVTWSSSDTSVATVNAKGLVTAKRYGKVTITATSVEDPTKSASCEIQTRFYDVNGSNVKGSSNYQYYYDAVYWAADNGITTGYDRVYFGPAKECTRAEMMIFLWRIAGCPEGYGDANDYFNDINALPEQATNKAIAWAYCAGITKGYSDGGFHQTDAITRLETMILLYRVAGRPDIEGEMKFKDCKRFNAESDSYRAILWGSMNNITAGYADGNFGVNDKCLREYIVTFLYRFSKL